MYTSRYLWQGLASLPRCAWKTRVGTHYLLFLFVSEFLGYCFSLTERWFFEEDSVFASNHYDQLCFVKKQINFFFFTCIFSSWERFFCFIKVFTCRRLSTSFLISVGRIPGSSPDSGNSTWKSSSLSFWNRCHKVNILLALKIFIFHIVIFFFKVKTKDN